MDQDWIFTFCGSHEHPNKYVVIRGTYGEARAEMFRRHGDRWGFQYPSKEAAGVDEFGLIELVEEK